MNARLEPWIRSESSVKWHHAANQERERRDLQNMLWADAHINLNWSPSNALDPPKPIEPPIEHFLPAPMIDPFSVDQRTKAYTHQNIIDAMKTEFPERRPDKIRDSHKVRKVAPDPASELKSTIKPLNWPPKIHLWRAETPHPNPGNFEHMRLS